MRARILTSSSKALISAAQLSQTTIRWGHGGFSPRMSFLSAFLEHSESGHGSSVNKQSVFMCTARSCLWHVNSQPVPRLRHSTESSSTIWKGLGCNQATY